MPSLATKLAKARHGSRPADAVDGVAPVRIFCGGSALDLLGSEQALVDAVERAMAGELAPLRVGSVNLDHLHRFRADGSAEEVRICAGRDWLMLVDGMPLVWAARRATGRAYPRLAGSDTLPELLRAAESAGRTVGFLGGTSESVERLASALAADFPALKVGGHWIPERIDQLSQAQNLSLAAEIRAAGVDLLVVGLGKPRQELWIERYGADTGASVLLAYGASADFIAGIVTRAPDVMRRNGLEWLYRLQQEPLRLYRRYLVEGPQAAALLLGAALRPSNETRIPALVPPAGGTRRLEQEFDDVLAADSGQHRDVGLDALGESLDQDKAALPDVDAA